MDLVDSLYCIAVVRAITPSPDSPLRLLVISAVIPSAKSSSSGPPRFLKDRTTRRGTRVGTVAGDFDRRAKRNVATATTMISALTASALVIQWWPAIRCFDCKASANVDDLANRSAGVFASARASASETPGGTAARQG